MKQPDTMRNYHRTRMKGSHDTMIDVCELTTKPCSKDDGDCRVCTVPNELLLEKISEAVKK